MLICMQSGLYIGRIRLEDERVKRADGMRQPSGQKLISFEEVEKHRTADDCWVIIDVSTLLC